MTDLEKEARELVKKAEIAGRPTVYMGQEYVKQQDAVMAVKYALLQRDEALSRVDELLALQAEERVFAQTAISDANAERDAARAALIYKGDEDIEDEHSPAILAAHPIKCGNWKNWSQALEMVSNRKSKGSLVNLVNWLLIERANAENAKKGGG